MSVKGLGSPAGKEPKSESLFLIGVHIRSFPPLTKNGIIGITNCLGPVAGRIRIDGVVRVMLAAAPVV
jgi:hypothetical protein